MTPKPTTCKHKIAKYILKYAGFKIGEQIQCGCGEIITKKS